MTKTPISMPLTKGGEVTFNTDGSIVATQRRNRMDHQVLLHFDDIERLHRLGQEIINSAKTDWCPVHSSPDGDEYITKIDGMSYTAIWVYHKELVYLACGSENLGSWSGLNTAMTAAKAHAVATKVTKHPILIWIEEHGNFYVDFSPNEYFAYHVIDLGHTSFWHKTREEAIAHAQKSYPARVIQVVPKPEPEIKKGFQGFTREAVAHALKTVEHVDGHLRYASDAQLSKE